MAIGGSPTAKGDAHVMVSAADVVLGAISLVGPAAEVARAGLTGAGRATGRILSRVRDTPLGQELQRPVDRAAQRGRRVRIVVIADLQRRVRALVPLVVGAALDQLDLTSLVRERVDLGAIAKSLDVDEVVAQVDVDRILDRVDLDAVVARVDVDQIIGRVDLIGLAEAVVEGIDLPGIIRESSGAMASDAVVGIRLQSLEADEALARAVRRWLPKRRGSSQSPTATQTEVAVLANGRPHPDGDGS